MTTSVFIEDLFLEFFDYINNGGMTLQQQDWPAMNSFYNSLVNGKALTKNQGMFLLKILTKYRIVMAKAGLDYTEHLADPKWKHEFRVIDLSKKIYIESDGQGDIWVCAKFPFSLKEEFAKEIVPRESNTPATPSVWDHEERVRRLKLYDYNLIAIYEFAMKHGFEIDESIMEALGEVEEIWQNADKVTPRSEVTENGVELFNAAESAVTYFAENKTNVIPSDLLLAKAMGFQLHSNSEDKAAKIAKSTSNKFWIKNIPEFLELYKETGGPVAIILDRGSSSTDWVKEFYNSAIAANVDKSDIRVCFRLGKEEDKFGFNQWLKDTELGGPVENGKIFIFQQKPPKWLFSKEVSVKIIVTNSLYPLPSNVTQTWMDSHTCVCFVGEIKASRNTKDNKIVEL